MNEWLKQLGFSNMTEFFSILLILVYVCPWMFYFARMLWFSLRVKKTFVMFWKHNFLIMLQMIKLSCFMFGVAAIMYKKLWLSVALVLGFLFFEAVEHTFSDSHESEWTTDLACRLFAFSIGFSVLSPLLA